MVTEIEDTIEPAIISIAVLPSRVTREELEVPLAPEEVSRRLASGMATVRSLLFSVTWGLSEDFVGNVADRRFQMRVRHAYSNGYTRLLFGSIEEAGSGSRIRLEFKDVRFIVVLMNVVSVGLVVAMLVYLSTFAGHATPTDLALGLAGPATVLVVFLICEIVGRRLGRRDEKRLREHVTALMRT